MPAGRRFPIVFLRLRRHNSEATDEIGEARIGAERIDPGKLRD